MSVSLAIDTSTSRTSVAIVEEGAILWHGFRDGGTAHGHALPALVAEAISAQGSIDKVVVGMGPGPYTGLRVGISFARSFALARGIEVIGLCSLDAIATQVRERNDFIIATDARRKEVYWAQYSNGARMTEPSVDFPADVALKGLPMFGEGALKYLLTADDEVQFPDVVALVEIAKNLDLHIQFPIYLRRPDAVPTSERTP